MLQKVPQIGHLSWPGVPDELLIFSLWWTRLAKWHPMVPKVVPRGPKGYQNRATMPPKSFKIWCKSNKQCIWLCDCFGKQVFEEIIQFWFKNCSKRYPKLEPRTDLELELPIFTLGSTWLPKWCPMVPKVAPRVSKGCQNEAKMPPKVFKMWVQN